MSLQEQLIAKADEAERLSLQPDRERDPGQPPDAVNEIGRTKNWGRAEAFREAAEMAAKDA